MLLYETKVLIDVLSWIFIPSLLLFLLIYFSLKKSTHFNKTTQIIIALLVSVISSISFFSNINPYENYNVPMLNQFLVVFVYSIIFASLAYILLKVFRFIPIKLTHKFSKLATFVSFILLIWVLGAVFNLIPGWYFLHSIFDDNMLVIISSLLSFSLIFSYITKKDAYNN